MRSQGYKKLQRILYVSIGKFKNGYTFDILTHIMIESRKKEKITIGKKIL